MAQTLGQKLESQGAGVKAGAAGAGMTAGQMPCRGTLWWGSAEVEFLFCK